MASAIYTFDLHGPIVPKARPRAWQGRNLLPENYRKWKLAAIADLRTQFYLEPLSNVAISIALIGKHSRRGDADNIAGAILDAMVQSGILKDDNLINVTALAIELQYDKTQQPKALITVSTS